MTTFSAAAALPDQVTDPETGEIVLRVSPDDEDHAELRQILLVEEMVHRARDVGQLQHERLGDSMSSKQVFMLLSPEFDRVRAMVSVALLQVPEKNGVIQPRDLPRNIQEVVATPSRSQTGSAEFNVVVP